MASRAPILVTTSLAPAALRRRSARVQLLGEVHGNLVGMSLPAVVRDISEGGFSIESSLQFPATAKHLFHLTLGADVAEPVVVEARVVHSGPVEGAEPKSYLTGFSFTGTQPHATKEDIEEVVALARTMADMRDEADDERRIADRLNVLGEMHGEVLSLGVPLLVRDFGLGGCSVETHAALEQGVEYPVRLHLSDSLSVSIRARVAHTRRECEEGRPPRFVSGLQFVDPVGQSRRELGEMLGLLTSTRDGD